MKRAFQKLFRKLAGKPVYILGRNTVERVAVDSMLQTENVDFIAASDLFRKNPYTPQFDIPEVPADWTPENAAVLKVFLETQTGKSLSDRLRYIVAANAINGARNTANTVHASGVSAGWDESVRYLHSLSRVSGVQDTTKNDEPPLGEMELLEKLSP